MVGDGASQRDDRRQRDGYLTFGPGNEKLGGLLSAMIPTAGIDAPTFADALRSIEWMVDDLDRSWREWVAKGSQAAK